MSTKYKTSTPPPVAAQPVIRQPATSIQPQPDLYVPLAGDVPGLVTEAMEVPGIGCLVRVRQAGAVFDGAGAGFVSLQWIPGVKVRSGMLVHQG